MNNPAANTQQFQLSINFKIGYFLIVALISTAIFKFNLPALKDGGLSAYLLLLAYPLAILLVIKEFFKKIIITPHSVKQAGIFTKTELAIENIKGFRLEERTIVLEPIDASLATITISGYNTLSDAEDLLLWVKTNLKDLNQLQLNSEKNALLQHSTLGDNPPQRMQQLQYAKAVATVYNYAAVAASFILQFFYYNKIADSIKIAIPLLGLLLILLSGNTIRFFRSAGKSIYPGVSTGILLSSFLLLYSAAKGYNWLSLWPIIPYVIVVAIVFVYISYTFGRDKSIAPHYSYFIILSVAALLYAAGAALTINCSFDNSVARPYQSKVITKYKTSGQNQLRMEISPWQPGYSQQQVAVPEEVYYQREPGQGVAVLEKAGLLGVHWFLVTMPVDSLVIPR